MMVKPHFCVQKLFSFGRINEVPRSATGVVAGHTYLGIPYMGRQIIRLLSLAHLGALRVKHNSFLWIPAVICASILNPSSAQTHTANEITRLT